MKTLFGCNMMLQKGESGRVASLGLKKLHFYFAESTITG